MHKNTNPIKTGIAGFGISAKVFHAPFIHLLPGYELKTVLERHRTDSPEVYPGTRVVRTIDELVNDEEIELIIITTPNDTHLPYAQKALRAGKNVVLEKPFTISTADAKALIDTSRETGKLLSVYHNRRYVNDFFTIQDIVKSGSLGTIHEFVAHYDRYRAEARPHAWREAPEPGSGILYDLGPHLIDQALFLFGQPKTITADIRLQRPHARVDDFFEIWMDYGFLKVSLHAGMLVREMGPRYMVNGTLGSYIKYGEDPQEALLRTGIKPGGEHWGEEQPEFSGILHTEENGRLIRKTVVSKKGDFGRYYENLHDTIRNGAPLREKPEHGYNTIRIVELAIQSNKEKRTIECDGLLAG